MLDVKFLRRIPVVVQCTLNHPGFCDGSVHHLRRESVGADRVEMTRIESYTVIKRREQVFRVQH